MRVERVSVANGLSACIVYPVIGDRPPDWTEGPFPIEIPAWARTSGWIDSPSADLTARSGYFDAGVLPALYGSTTGPSRWHRPVDLPLTGAHVWGHEMVRVPAAASPRAESGLLIVHCSIVGDAIAQLEALTRIPPAGAESRIRSELSACLPPGWKFPDRRLRAYTAVLADCHADLSNGESIAGAAPDDLSLWLLASATRLKSFRPSEADLLTQATIRLSADWSALALRDGIGFLSHASSPEFHGLAVALVHSVYLDVLLLGIMQVRGVEDVSATLADRRLARERTRDLIHLERRLFRFRRQVWWTEVGRHNATALLTAFQEQHSLPKRMESVVADVSDGARLAQSVTSARAAAALGVVSLAGVPFSIVFAATALLVSRGWLTFAIAAASAIVLSIALAAAGPLHELMSRGDADE